MPAAGWQMCTHRISLREPPTKMLHMRGYWLRVSSVIWLGCVSASRCNIVLCMCESKGVLRLSFGSSDLNILQYSIVGISQGPGIAKFSVLICGCSIRTIERPARRSQSPSETHVSVSMMQVSWSRVSVMPRRATGKCVHRPIVWPARGPWHERGETKESWIGVRVNKVEQYAGWYV